MKFSDVYFLSPKGMQLQRIKTCFVVIICLLTLPLSGHSKRSPGAVIATTRLPIHRNADNTYEIAGEINELTIPLKRVGNLFLIDAVVDNQTGNLVFDTGAMGLVLNTTYYRNHVVEENHPSNGVNGSISIVSTINIDRLSFSELTIKRLKADLTDLGHLENRRKVKILGLLGLSLIKNFEIIIDVNNNQLQLSRIDNKGNRLNTKSKSFQADITQPFETSNNVIFLRGTIKGKKLNFCMDSGSETNVISNRTSKEVLSSITITRRSSLQGSGSKKSEVFYGTMNNFIYFNKELTGMETIITNLDGLSDAYGVQIDGVLGYDFLNKGTVCINLQKKQLGICFLKPEAK
jgi:predicted aspartyl protease